MSTEDGPRAAERPESRTDGPRGPRAGEGREPRAGAGDDGVEGQAADTGPDAGFLTVSNLLSLSRIPLGVSFLAIDDPRWLAAVVAVGGITDLADGFIARVSRTVSHVGLLLDPFCDKLFVLLCLISFLPDPSLDWAGFLILVLRDVFTGGSYLLGRILGKVIPFRPRWAGKIVTSLQLLTLLALIFWPGYVALLVILVGLASVYSIADYGMSALREEQRRALAG